MVIRSRTGRGLFVLLMIIFVLTVPMQTFAKRSHVSKRGAPAQKNEKTPKATEGPQKTEPSKTSQDPLHCDAQSALLMDAQTGEVLYEQNPHVRIPPASFVKIVTLYLAFDALRAGQLKLDDTVTVSEKAWRTQGSKMFIKIGSSVKVEDLLKGIAIASGNDACVALAEHMAGSEEVFVSKMNEKASLLGLKDSQFKNCDGMPFEGQYTSAMDMAVLSKRYIEDHPEALALHSATEFEYNGIRQGNRNTLLYKNIGVDGLKTGHIGDSGYHLVATAKRDGQRMISVVMGCDKVKSRAPAAQKLLEYGFKNFSTVEALKKGAPFGPVKVKRGKMKEIVLTATEEIRLTVAKGKESSISVVPDLPNFVLAPIQKGQVVGKVVVQKEGKILKEVNLVSSADVEKSLLFSWPVIGGGILGICAIGLFGFFWVRRPRRKKL